MNSDDTRKPSLDDVVDAIRTDEPSREELAASAARVRTRLGLTTASGGSTVHIESCAGFQSLIPAFLDGALPAETALLLEDHTRECIPCRRALIAARTPKRAPSGRPASGRALDRRWLAAAAVAAVAVLGAYTGWQALPLFGGNPQLKVMRVDGSVYQLASGTAVPLRPGMTISAKNPIKTAKDGGALVMMDDGSRIEMRDRTELSVDKRRDGSTVRLAGGAVIVEASPQGSGHLDVRTDDCLVAVKGTIFAVNTGVKGSRVSVVEGAVRVAADGRESLLKPGDQMTTSDAVARVGVDRDIAWSQDAGRYAQVLNELASLRKDLERRVPKPGLRYSSRLLDRMPDGTVLYAAIPNLTTALVAAKQVFDEHVAQSPGLQAWWESNMSSPEQRRNMDAAFESIKTLGNQVGDEIVIGLVQNKHGRMRGPVVMAEVKDKSEFRRTLASQVKANDVHVDASMSFDGPIAKIEFTCPEHAMTASTGTTKARAVSAWSDSPLHDRLASAYANGTSWVFGVDLQALLTQAMDQARASGHADVPDRLERMGVLDAQYLVVEHTDATDGALLHGELTFDQPRRGLASWLADPAPMGAADFVSPDAAFAAAAVVKRPELLLLDAVSWISPAAGDDVHDVDLSAISGIASTLGGDVAVALDGPILPVPSWKFVIEVYDPARFQTELQQLLGTVNDKLATQGQAGRFVLASEDGGNRTDWVLRFTGDEADSHVVRYTMVDGYLVAAPSRALIDLAIDRHRNGYTLVRSQAFTSMLPTDGNVNLSAFAWQHLGPTVGPLASKVSGAISSESMTALQSMAEEDKPRLVTLSAESDRIVIDARGEAGLSSLFGSILSAHNMGALGNAVLAAKAAEKTKPQ